MEIIWAVAAILIGAPTGVTLALQWGKNQAQALRVREAAISLELAKQNDVNEANRQRGLDDDLTRAERQLALEQAQTPESKELKAAELALKAAEKRTAAIEAQARAEHAGETARVQAEADRVAIEARKQALVRQADIWAKENPPQRFKDPLESVDLASLYRSYMNTCVTQRVAAHTFGRWLGDNYRKASQGA